MSAETLTTAEDDAKAIEHCRQRFSTWSEAMNLLLYEYDESVDRNHPVVICLWQLVKYADHQVEQGADSLSIASVLKSGG